MSVSTIILFLFALTSFCYSNGEARLSVTQLIAENNYPVEEHFVTTDDGYILRLHRIPHGKNASVSKNKVVFIVHGLTLSSADWILTGPKKALGYVLADEGYDVWLGNTRGNHESRNHTKLNPDKDFQFWNFTWHQCGTIDLPNMIDYILNHTNKTQLFHIGHSQGTTIFYVMATMRPEYNKKVIAHFSFAPTVFMKNMKSPLVLLAKIQKLIQIFATLFKWGELLPNRPINGKIAAVLCPDDSPLQFLCKDLIYVSFGSSPKEMNTTFLPTLFAYVPAGGSVLQLIHFLQEINSGKFCQFDYGYSRNLKTYGTLYPQAYDLQKIATSVYVFYSRHDKSASVKDVLHLCQKLGTNCKGAFLNEDRQFNHLDYLYGTHVVELVYVKVINLLSQF